jgi:hypothetical protein
VTREDGETCGPGWTKTPLYPLEVVTDEMVARAVNACWPGYGMNRETAMRAALTAALTPAQVTAPDAAARKLYDASIGDAHNLHCRAWWELTDAERDKWRNKAALKGETHD